VGLTSKRNIVVTLSIAGTTYGQQRDDVERILSKLKHLENAFEGIIDKVLSYAAVYNPGELAGRQVF
jgi:formiminotetrahydrofolate cyclodeaminase